MKHLAPLTHTLFKALWLGAALSTSLSLVAAESPTKTEPKPAKGVKNKPKSPVTKVMMTNCDNIKDFNAKQKEVLKAAYQFGSKENLGYEMAGIAWKESCAGVYKINFSDPSPSAGVYHSYIPSVLKSYGHNDSPFLRNVMGELLIKDDAFASEVALKELLYWKTRYHDNLKDMIKSYNKGSRWERNEKSNAEAEKYYEEIQDRIRRLKESKIFDSQSSNDQELQKSANSNLDLDPIGNAMPQTLAAQKSQIEKSQTEETQAEKSQEMKEATSEQTANKPEKAKDKPMYLAQISSADFTPAKKNPKKPAKANPKRSSKNNIKNNVKNNTKTASKKQEVCKNCSPGQRNAILANHITLMQEL
ncbi:hypothetical protein [Helicobacter pylori]|uniref:hypothetical protein n=1 Tax=Helicobacter pylori TaxID=210 RepID=UPI000EAFB337|nr:hypothetical protein [Helicobacter pylori]RKV13003.1 hypothetical protein DDP52_05610 [Helicobacter pylori]